jgi:hypothetical protein
MSSRMYPSLTGDTFDAQAEEIARETAQTPAELRYSKMRAQQAAEQTDYDLARRDGWRRATDQNLQALKRFPGMAGRYDYEPDDPRNPEAGGWIRAREAKEGLNAQSLKAAGDGLRCPVKGY